jgi:hypothetical protein
VIWCGDSLAEPLLDLVESVERAGIRAPPAGRRLAGRRLPGRLLTGRLLPAGRPSAEGEQDHAGSDMVDEAVIIRLPQNLPYLPDVLLADEELAFAVHELDPAIAGHDPDLDPGMVKGGSDVVDLVGDPGFKRGSPAVRSSHVDLPILIIWLRRCLDLRSDRWLRVAGCEGSARPGCLYGATGMLT